MATTSINHRSVLDACNTRLSAAAKKKKVTMSNHTNIPYRVIYPLKIIVRHKQEISQNITFKIKGGEKNRN